MLAVLLEGKAEQKDLSCLMHSCQTAKLRRQIVFDRENMTERIQHSSKSVPETIRGRIIASVLDKELKLSVFVIDIQNTKIMKENMGKILQ